MGTVCDYVTKIEVCFRLRLKLDKSHAGLLQCYERYNKPDDNGVLPGPQRCGMLLKAVMEGAKDTPTCIRRSNMIMNLSPRKLLCIRYVYFITDENLNCFVAVLCVFVKKPLLIFLLHPCALACYTRYIYVCFVYQLCCFKLFYCYSFCISLLVVSMRDEIL